MVDTVLYAQIANMREGDRRPLLKGGPADVCPCTTARRCVVYRQTACYEYTWSAQHGPYEGGGGVTQAGISAIQILCEIFVRDLFGVFKDLCGCTLGIASAHCFS